MSINYGNHDISTSGTITTSGLYINGNEVSLVGHTHTSSNITDLTESVQDIVGASGFLVPGTGISINYNDGANTLTVSTTGLQPSGNYSIIGHTHTSSDITNFNSSVSGVVSTVSVVSLGTLTGSNAINGGINNAIQILTLNGTAVTFTKGAGWSSTADTSTDTVLKITASSPTSITWTIVNQWFNQYSGPLATGVHLFVLRSVGTSTIEGHYIGSQT